MNTNALPQSIDWKFKLQDLWKCETFSIKGQVMASVSVETFQITIIKVEIKRKNGVIIYHSFDCE